MARDFRARFDNVRVRLSQETGRIRKSVNDQMQKEAEGIQKDAIALAPLDSGALEQAIKVENLGGRRAWAVYIDRNAPADIDQVEPTGVLVGEYAFRLHEDPEGTWKWQAKTRSKPSVRGMSPGSRFLERAYRSRIRGFTGRLRKAAEQGRTNDVVG